MLDKLVEKSNTVNTDVPTNGLVSKIWFKHTKSWKKD